MRGDVSSGLAPMWAEPAIGQTLGRYQLLRAVARGGMGTIWAARATGAHGFERLVAIKTIRPDAASDSSFRAMFLDEARIAARVIHPNVVQVLDLGDENGVLFQALEWIDGESLRSLARLAIEKGMPIPPAIAIRIVSDASMGLHAAHEVRDESGVLLDVIHRDVSPHNILVSVAGAVKVSDFGIAKARDRLSDDTSDGRIKGKLRYMAPEQAMGGQLDRRADIWAIGAILYELLTGHTPYEAPNDLAVLSELISGPPTLLFEEPVDAGIAAIIRRALSRNPEGRYASAAELARELHAVAGRAQLLAAPDDLAAFCKTVLSQGVQERHRAISTAVAFPLPASPDLATACEPQPGSSDDGAAVAEMSTALDPQPGPITSTSSWERGLQKRSRAAWLVLSAAAVLVLSISSAWWLGGRSPAAAPAAVPQAMSADAPSASVTAEAPGAASSGPQPSMSTAEPAASQDTHPSSPSSAKSAKRAPGPPRTHAQRPPFEQIDDGF